MDNTVKWEDYEIRGLRATETAKYMDDFMNVMFPDPEDRLYMDENYFSMLAHKIDEAEKLFDVEFKLSI